MGLQEILSDQMVSIIKSTDDLKQASFLNGLLRAAEIAAETNIDRFGKLDKFQVVDAIMDEVKKFQAAS